MATGTTTHLGLTTVETGDRLPEAVSKTNFETIDSYVAARALTNKSGSTVAANSVVVVDTTADSSFTTTTTAGATKVTGVTQASIDNNAAGIVKQYGVSSVLVTGATSRGNWLTTSTVAGQALSSSATNPPVGTFAIALTATVGAGTVTALLLTPSGANDPTTTAGDLVFRNATVLTRLGIGTALQQIRTNAGATAPEWFTPTGASLESDAQTFVETSGYKQFFSLGPPVNGNANAYANGALVGLGFAITKDATTASIAAETTTGVDYGAWKFATGATASEDAGVTGPLTEYKNDWTLVWRGRIPSAANQTIVIGSIASGLLFADANNFIGFRVLGTGNVVGVVDSAGTETTRDTSATGATEMTLRIEVRSGGTIVRFYKNNAQIGADVTTNIPTTNSMRIACGVQTSSTDVNFFTHDLFGWREVGSS